MSETPSTDALKQKQAHRDWNPESRKPVDHPAQIAEWIRHSNALELALRAILADPYGCRFCDCGKLRDPTKDHDPQCGYALAARFANPRQPMTESEKRGDPLDEICPRCKAIPGKLCRDAENGNRAMAVAHDSRARKAIRRINRDTRRIAKMKKAKP